MPRPPFKFSAEARVGFSDTDAQGVVYYGRYMPYFDLARVEYHRHLDMLRTDPQDKQFVMRAMTVEYHAPARFDDPIEVDVPIRLTRTSTSIGSSKRAGAWSVTYEFAAYLEGDALAVTATQTLVLLDLAERRPCPVPEWWRERIREFEGADVDA